MTKAKTIRLASYNIRKCVGLDRRRKPERIIDVINGLDADVVALQEADRRLGDRPAALPARLIEEHTDFRVVSRKPAGPSLGSHGNAVLVHKNVNVTNVFHLDLPGTEPRGAVVLEIGGQFRIASTHLGLMRSDRRRQCQTIVDHLEQLGQPSVVIGDLNEWSPSRGLEPLQEQFNLHSPGRSFHAVRPVAALDRVALSDGLELRDAGVVDTRKTRIASDHLPIWAEISLPVLETAD